MHYPIQQKDLLKTYIFWFAKYVKNKALTLNNSKANQEKLQYLILKLDEIERFNSIDEVYDIVKELRKSGISTNVLSNPIKKFIDYLILKDVYPKEINNEVVYEFLTTATANKSDYTKKTYKVAIADFLKFISKNNNENYLINVDVQKWQKNLNLSYKPPVFLKDKELAKILDELEKYTFSKDELNNLVFKIAFKLAIFAGMRESEIVNLQTDHININKIDDEFEILILDSKANKSRKVTIPYSLIEKDIEEYLKNRKPCSENKKILLCIKAIKGDKKGNYVPLYHTLLYQKFRTFLTAVGINKPKKGMHLLRHTFATIMFKHHKNIILVKELMGHADTKTTARYTHLEEDVIKKATNIFKK